MRHKCSPRRLAALALALTLLSGCGGGTVPAAPAAPEESPEALAAFEAKAEALRGAVLSARTQDGLAEDPAGEAGYAVFLSVCGGAERARVYGGTGDTPERAWDGAVRAAGDGVKQGGPVPLWVKADLVYVSAVLPAAALEGLDEVFGPWGFRYGLAFDPGFGTALLEAELNTAGIYGCAEGGGVDLAKLNSYLEQTGRQPLDALPEEYTAFQCAGWLCGEDGSVLALSPEEEHYGRREMGDVTGVTAAALALDGAEYLAGRVREDGSILLDGEEPLDAARHAEVLSAMVQGFRLAPGEALAGGIGRAADRLLKAIAYTEGDMAYLPDGGEITLETSALALIALADCAEASGEQGYTAACEALGAGIMSLLDTGSGSFTHVLNAADLGRKEAFRSAAWDGMAVTALCRLYGLTEDALWLWAAEQVLDRMVRDDAGAYGDLWTARALREAVRYARDRTDYFAFALKLAQRSLPGIYTAQGTAPEGLETLMLSYETYREMLDAGYSAGGFELALTLQVIASRAERQMDGYLFPEFAMYFEKPAEVLGAFMTREEGLAIQAGEMCRNIGGYSLYAANYDALAADGLTGQADETAPAEQAE